MRKYDIRKALVIKQLASAFAVGENYIRMILRGEVDNETADRVKKEYNRLYNAINNVLK